MSAPLITAHPPRWVRAVHWINACAFTLMLLSGWQIYNADPYWIDAFPRWLTLGGTLPGALQWHFAAMWVFAGNGAIAMLLLVAGGRLRRMYLSIRPREIMVELKQILRHPLAHQDGHRNVVQKIAYLVVLALLALEITSGLAIWKPVQLRVITDAVFQGYEYARRTHFLCMAMLASFVAGHILLAFLSPQLLMGMLGIRRSRPRQR